MTVEPPPEGQPWTVLHLIRWSAEYLADNGVDDGRLHAEHLLADALETGRLELYLQYDRPLVPAELAAFKQRLKRRAAREPLQHILGATGFRELELKTDGRALIPRPETEELVQAVLDWARQSGTEGLSALDVGTGTGAIALSLAAEGPFEKVVASDRSPEALELASENRAAARLEGAVELREGDLLEVVRSGERFQVVVSNPPYVAERELPELAPEVRDFEPVDALVAEEDGLGALMALVEGAASCLAPGGLLALEVGVGQAATVAERIRESGRYQAPRVLRDLGGKDRIVLAEVSAEADP